LENLTSTLRLSSDLSNNINTYQTNKHRIKLTMSASSAEASDNEYNASPAIDALIDLLKHRGFDPAYNKDTWFKIQDKDVEPLKEYLLPIVKEAEADHNEAFDQAKAVGMNVTNHFRSMQAKVDEVKAGDKDTLGEAIFVVAAFIKNMKRLTNRLQTRVRNYHRLKKGSDEAGWESWTQVCNREGRRI
jgi:hypothetical protein